MKCILCIGFLRWCLVCQGEKAATAHFPLGQDIKAAWIVAKQPWHTQHRHIFSVHQAAWAQEQSKQKEDFISRPCNEANKQYTNSEPDSMENIIFLRKHGFSREKMNVDDRDSERKGFCPHPKTELS